MNFALTEEQRAIQELAARIFQDHVTPKRLHEVEHGPEGIDRALWQRLAEAHALGIPLPESCGGSDLGVFEFCLLLEEAGRSLAPVPLLPAIVSAALPIARFGMAAQRDKYLPSLVAGKTLLTAALGDGSAIGPHGTPTSARRAGATWRIDGEKDCVPIGALADRILLPARVGGTEIGIFLVDPHTPGVTCEAQPVTNRQASARVRLSDVSVPGDDMLGTPAEGTRILQWIEQRTALGACALQLGVAEQAVRLTAEYTSTRKQFGRPIATFQGVALRAADAYIDVEAMRSVFWEAAWRVGADLPAGPEVAAAAWWACTAGQRVVHTAQHLHGGIGADVEYPIHRYFLWAKQLELTLGGAARQLAQLGTQLPTI